ncbi:MAG: hypothetical protein RLZZ168_1508 [Cyanobacteriota bacterium]
MLVLLLGLGPGSAPAAAATAEPYGESCAPISGAQAEALFERWNGALQTGDPDQVVALYSPDALLLPTLSAEPRQSPAAIRAQSPAAIRAYFEQFLSHAPRGRIDSRVLQLGCNEVVDAGTYSFWLDGDHWVAARYTFVYAFTGGAWRIVHHHSSLVPTPQAA